MADITYYEDGYIAQGYHVYTADAMIILGDYIESNYLVDDYFTFTGSKATVVCEGSRLRIIEVESAISVSASTSITGSKDARTDVTLVSIANISSQADRLRGIDSTITSTFTQTSSATRIRTASTDFSSIATQLTVAFQNATGTILMEPTATLTALVGVIKQASTTTVYGAQFYNDSNWLIYTDNTQLPYGVYKGMVVSFWLRKELTDSGGFIWNSYGDRTFPQGDATNLFYTDNDIYWSSVKLTAPNSTVGFEFYNAIVSDSKWHHYALVFTNWSGAFPGNFSASIYRDGVFISSDSATGPSTYGHNAQFYRDNRIGYQSRIGLAQLWVGGLYDGSTSPTGAQIISRIENFYDQNGDYRDLGDIGVVNGFTPGIYEPFRSPFSAKITSNGADLSTFRGDLPISGIFGDFDLQADSVTVLEVTSVPQAVFTLSAVIGRRQNFTASLVSQAQLSATANMVASAGSQQAASCSLTADYSRTRNFSSDLNTSLSLSATAIKIRQLAAAFTSTTQLSADVGETTELAAVMATAATLELAAIRLRDHTATLTAQAQLAARIDDRLRDQSATLASSATLICLAQTLEGVDSLMASQFAITVNTEVVKVAGAALIAQFTQSTQVFRVAVGSAHLQVQAFELTQGDIINFAPELIYRVPAESRTRRVLEESRVYDCDSESRTRRVLAESRVLSIEQETEVNII